MVGLIWQGYLAVVRRLNSVVRLQFQPRTRWTRDPDPLLTHVRRLRVLGGVAIVAWASYGYAPLDRSRFWAELVSSVITAPWVKAPIAFVAFLVMTASAWFVVDTAERRPMLARLFRPLLTAFGIGLGFVVVIGVGAVVLTRVERDPDQGPLVLVVFVPFLFVMAVAIPVLWTLARLAVVTSFNANEGHPYLPAAVGIAVSVYGLASGAYTEAHGGTHAYFPVLVRIALSIGGPIVTAGLSIWEIRRLHREGITMARPFGALSH